MLTPEDEHILNRLDPTDNRGKINRVNSFEIAQECAITVLKISKGGSFKNSGTKSQPKPSGSNQTESLQATIKLHILWRM